VCVCVFVRVYVYVCSYVRVYIYVFLYALAVGEYTLAVGGGWIVDDAESHSM